MQLLVAQCRHHLKNFQRACLKHRTIYTRPYRLSSQIPTANFSLSTPQKDLLGRPQSSVDSSMPPQRREIINFESPATQFGIVAGTFLRHKARSLGFRVFPDGFVRVSDVLTYTNFARYTFDQFAHFVKNDPMDRFEMAFLHDLIDGVLQKVWCVRAKYGHTMPAVAFGNRRVIHVGKLGTVYYITRASNWEYIREHGIPEGPDRVIQVFNKTNYDFYQDVVPVYEKALCVSIDPWKAVVMGVKFFHSKSVQLIATGNQGQAIPFKALESVVELEITKETLK